jgi:hypothetical protein
LPLLALLGLSGVDRDRTSVTQLGAFEAAIADDNVRDVGMLEDHARFAGRDTLAAIGAFLYEHDIGAVIATIDGVLGASLHALAALCADSGLVDPRLGEMRLDLKAGFFWIYFIKTVDSADLHTQTAAAALARGYFDSL